MSVVLNPSAFISVDIREDVTALQNFVCDINSLCIDHSHSSEDLKHWLIQCRELNKQIADFNNRQKRKALCYSSIDDTKQLLLRYLENHGCIQATQKTSKGMKNNVFITYRTKTIGFNEFFSEQPKLYSKYIQFKNSMMSLAHCVFANLNIPSDGNAIFGRFICAGGANPYSSGSHNMLIKGNIERSQAASISGIKKFLMQFFVALFSDDIAPVTGKMTRFFVTCVSDGYPVESLIDVLFEAYVCEKKKRPYQESKIDFSSSISRHVAWCTYRGIHKECVLLQQPCHASVDCAFYRENPSKRNQY